MSTSSGLKVSLNDDTTSSAVLKSFPEAELVVRIYKYFCATWGSSMFVLSTTIIDLPQNLIYWLISNSVLLCKLVVYIAFQYPPHLCYHLMLALSDFSFMFLKQCTKITFLRCRWHIWCSHWCSVTVTSIPLLLTFITDAHTFIYNLLFKQLTFTKLFQMICLKMGS